MVQNLYSRSQSFQVDLYLKLNGKVMMTSNIDVQLINGQIGAVHRIKTDSLGK